MAKKTIKKATKSKAKKQWVGVHAPSSFDNTHLGDTYVEMGDKAIGKSVTANLMNLTGDMRKQGVELRFDITKVADGKAQTAVTSYELLPGNIKRLVRRGRSKVDDSFNAKTKSGRRLRLKPFVITNTRVSAAACTAIRLSIRQKLKELVSKTSFDMLVQDLISHKLQKTLKEHISKVCPIRSVDIKRCELITEDGKHIEDITQAEPEKAEA